MQYNDFGKFIRNKRTKLNYSLNKFAFICELEPASLSNFERGNNDIYFMNFIKIANGFSTTPAQLLSEYEKEDS